MAQPPKQHLQQHDTSALFAFICLVCFTYSILVIIATCSDAAGVAVTLLFLLGRPKGLETYRPVMYNLAVHCWRAEQPQLDPEAWQVPCKPDRHVMAYVRCHKGLSLLEVFWNACVKEADSTCE